MCAAMYYLLNAEPLVYLIKIIQGLVAGVRVCCNELCVEGRALGVSDQDYPRAGGRCACVQCVGGYLCLSLSWLLMFVCSTILHEQQLAVRIYNNTLKSASTCSAQ